jgi:hypothetical protein
MCSSTSRFGPFIVIAFIVAFASCSHEPPSQPKPAGDFPNSVGSVWVYNVIDNLHHSARTVTVRVARETDLPRFGRVAMWEFSSPQETDTQYVAVSADTVLVLECTDPRYCATIMKYVFPLEVGKQWDPGFYAGSTSVTQEDTVTVGAGTFSQAFRLEQSWYALNEGGGSTIWIVPRIGIVQRSVQAHLWTSGVNETWELIHYDLSQ